MGKVSSLLVACGLIASAMPVLAPHPAVAQTLALPCSVTAPSPMQGQYSGPWHSDGDYTFSVFNTDLDLKIIIDGTLSLAVSPDGHVSGTATGTVNAPIHDYGRLDVSSGYGTISGTLTGNVSGTGAVWTLTAPVIFMHWGTFVGGGYTVDQNITMPDYTFTVGGGDCISSQGTIAETNFPTKWIVPDGTNLAPVQAPGIGSATGTWSITSSDAGLYSGLSQQVDSFITSANGILAGNPTFATAETQIAQPLAALVTSIEAHPTVSRCLLERLGAWEASAATNEYGVANTLAEALPADPAAHISSVRGAADAVRIADVIGAACHGADGGVSDRLTGALTSALHGASRSSDLPATALLARELLLWKGTSGRASVRSAIDTGVQGQMSPQPSTSSLLAILRQAYIFGDDADAASMYKEIAAATHSMESHSKKKKGKKGTTHKHKPTPTATPRPTATSTPRTLEGVLTSGITSMSGKATGGDVPTFSWSPVTSTDKEPVHYVVTVTGPGSTGIAWTWEGTAPSVTYGDTGLPDVPGSAGDGWSLPLPSGYHWTVLALDGTKVIGLKLR